MVTTRHAVATVIVLVGLAIVVGGIVAVRRNVAEQLAPGTPDA